VSLLTSGDRRKLVSGPTSDKPLRGEDLVNVRSSLSHLCRTCKPLAEFPQTANLTSWQDFPLQVHEVDFVLVPHTHVGANAQHPTQLEPARCLYWTLLTGVSRNWLTQCLSSCYATNFLLLSEQVPSVFPTGDLSMALACLTTSD
jgi:hypothetical protein